MARVGIDATTGRCLVGWDHCLQSIIKILTTELRERVQLRGFGSMLARLLDRPQNPETVIDFYMATAEALEPRMIEGRQLGEPGFVLLQSSVNLSVPGTVRLEVGGVFFENGHLGDYSNPVERTAILSIVVAEGQVSVGAL